MSLSTHVLDTGTGRPAVGVQVRLESAQPDGWRLVGTAATDQDGRLRDWLPPGAPGPGRHRLIFDTGSYFAGAGAESLFPQVSIDLLVRADAGHLHVPLLVSPFAYSTYRGS